jgi:methylmalonyl-CoA mutase cobalamin-binding subunit
MFEELGQAVIERESEEAVALAKPTAEFVAAVEENEAGIVGASALLTTTMVQQARLIEALTEAGLRDKVKVMVGGAPVTESLARDNRGGWLWCRRDLSC